MEKKISKTDEMHLTRAVEKAAALASVNSEHDRDRLLADQLRQEKVNKRFAKTAAAAFNKRMTVLLLEKTADEHKADPYDLADPDHVYELMGGENTQLKSAALAQDAFSVSFTPVMEKVAAVAKQVRDSAYEKRVRLDTFMEHLESVLEKQASEFQNISGMYESLDSKIADETAQVVADLRKLGSQSVELDTLGRMYGKKLSDVLDAYLGCGEMKKSAAVVPVSGGIYDKVASLLSDMDARENLRDYICSYKEGLSEFLKSASAASEVVEWARYHGADMTKMAADDWTQSVQDDLNLRADIATVGSAITGGLATGGALIGEGVHALTDTVHTLHNSLGAGFGNAYKMYAAGRDTDVGSGKLLDAEFLTNDRYRDRMLAWSDMTADPMFSMYPANQVFSATQKALNTSLALERPDNREALRETVGQLLMQNNRFSTADIAALSQTLKALAASQPSGAMAAGEAAREAGKVEHKTELALNPVLQPIVNSSKIDLAEAMSKEWEKTWESSQKSRDEARQYKYRKWQQDASAAKERRHSINEMALKTILAEAQETDQTAHLVQRDGRLGIATAGNGVRMLTDSELNRYMNDAAAMFDAYGGEGKELTVAHAKEQVDRDNRTREERHQDARRLWDERRKERHQDARARAKADEDRERQNSEAAAAMALEDLLAGLKDSSGNAVDPSGVAVTKVNDTYQVTGGGLSSPVTISKSDWDAAYDRNKALADAMGAGRAEKLTGVHRIEAVKQELEKRTKANNDMSELLNDAVRQLVNEEAQGIIDQYSNGQTSGKAPRGKIQIITTTIPPRPGSTNSFDPVLSLRWGDENRTVAVADIVKRMNELNRQQNPNAPDIDRSDAAFLYAWQKLNGGSGKKKGGRA